MNEFHQWCENVEEINQLNLVACLRQVLRLPASKSLENACVALSTLKMLQRLDVPKKFPVEFAIARFHFDAALTKTWSAWKTEEQHTSAWWVTHEDFACLILPAAALDKVLVVEDSWDSVKQEVHEISEGSLTGKRIMAKAIKQLEPEATTAKINELMHALEMNVALTP